MVTLTLSQTVGLTFDAGVTFPNPPTWASDNIAVATVIAASNGLTAIVTPVNTGNANITATGVSTAGVTYNGTILVDVISGGAVTASIIPGVPQ